jgi:hypothetical protein
MRSESSDAKWFDDRPRRTKLCGQCGGCGTVEVSYALMPADGVVAALYAADAPTNSIRACVAGSNDIFTACKEAADIAGRSSAPVAFEFLDHTVVVRSGDDPTTVARQWWMKQYGETPEQTRARR